MSLASRKIAFVFPGQGAQKVGMGRVWAEAVPAARAAFEEADAALGFPLSRLCWEGPEEELGLTENTQPALVATSIAIHRALGVLAPEFAPVAMAGHSLGEYSALVAAGALGFADALRLVRRRGQLMQAAVPVGVGAMAAIIGMDPEAIANIAKEAADAASSGGAEEVCAVANLNGPAQTVLAGHKGAIDRAVALARERGARKATLLAVSAPFHSPLMRPAREGLAPMLAATPFHDPRVPVVSNVDAVPVASGDAAREALVRQIDSPVRWVESVQWMEDVAGVQAFVEVGPGNVLTGLTRRIVRSARTTAVSDPDHLRQLLTEED
ncbi:MAG TPA: ACP S-malonyltransferase [Thermoanaerobaculia bacterium]|jgi:[acyl-carrier-protein] S-malonyltransferase|nr:ACP S-malonyltransferase [Thermoanaerobaculia bacterium]